MSSETEEKEEIIGGNYLIKKEIGRGGMGAVYLAVDKRLQRETALKMLSLSDSIDPDSKAEIINNFKRETIVIHLEHPNIVNVFDIGQINENTYYIVMELLDGQPLSKILQLHPLMPDMVLNISFHICDALSYVHKNGIIHRDIKPENIIYSGKGIAKLADFGIAKFKGEVNNNKKDGLVGTVVYSSPEQLRNPEDIDEKADIYSFGVSLYEMLTGKIPFDSENPRDVVIKILTEDPIPPSQVMPMVPPQFDKIVLKAMSKDKNERYESVEQLLLDLKNLKDELDGKKQPKIEKIPEVKEVKPVEQIQQSTPIVDKEDNFTLSISCLIPKITDQGVVDFLTAVKNFSKPIGEIIKSFEKHFSYSDPLNYLMKELNKKSQSTEIILLLYNFNGDKNLREIIDENYSLSNLAYLFNFIYYFHINKVIQLEVTDYNSDNKITMGDIFVAFNYIDRSQLEMAIVQFAMNSMMGLSKNIGEELVKLGFVDKDKALFIEKVEVWYKNLLGL